MKTQAPVENVKDILQCYLADIASTQPLSAKEEVALAQQIQNGDTDALKKLVEANLRFVVRVAREYQHRGEPLLDLIGAGNLGLIIAAERFDASRGVKFISYAVWWIRQGIQKVLKEQSKTIRIPLNRVDLMRQILLYVNSKQENTLHIDEEEVAEALGVSLEMVQDTLAMSQNMRSLDAILDADSKSLMEQMPDETEDATDVLLFKNSLKKDIEIALSSLDKREQKIIRLYFGLDEDAPMTLNDIGSRFKLTRERVRQIKDKALHKLRHPKRARKLTPYVNEN